jgi:hypothetical protein
MLDQDWDILHPQIRFECFPIHKRSFCLVYSVNDIGGPRVFPDGPLKFPGIFEIFIDWSS